MKTFLGYKDEKQEGYLRLSESLPLITEEKYSSFLLTTKQLLTSSTPNIKRTIIQARVKSRADYIQDIIVTILIIPGVISSIVYLLNQFELIALPEIPMTIMNLTFWLAILGGVILWYQSFVQQEVSDHIIQPDKFTDKEAIDLTLQRYTLGKYRDEEVCKFLNFKSQKYLSASIIKDKISAFRLLEILLDDNDIQVTLDKLDIEDFGELLDRFKINDQTMPSYPLSGTRSILIYSAEEAILSGYKIIRPVHLFISLFKVFPVLKQYLQQKKLNIETMRQVALWLKINEEQIESTRVFNPNNPYRRTGGILDSIVYGYTYIFNHYSRNLNRLVAKDNEHYGIGHEDSLDELMSIISKISKNNAIIVGENGTGKTSLVLGLAERVNLGNVSGVLKGKRILQLDVNGLVAASQKHGGIEAVIAQSMEELQRSGDTILFIDEMQEIVSTHAKESKNTIAGILLPYIVESKYPVIGTMSFRDYKMFSDSADSMVQNFHIIEIDEVSQQAAFQILLSRLSKLERIYDLEITFPAIMSAIQLSQRYIQNRKLPDSAVSTMETACAAVQSNNEKKITSSHISQTISNLTSIPVGETTKEESDRLLKLEERIKEKVIGQDEAVHEVVEVLKRARADVRDPNKPIGTFLFLGPTGVGKTYLAKTLNEEYFGNKEDIIRLDMSEFKGKNSVERLLGTPEDKGATTFLDKVRRNPYSVILLDEIEKAHPEILDLFLQVLDEGRMTDSSGETVDLNNTIIICTSNIGSKYLLETLRKSELTFESAKQKVLEDLKESLKVEFINRFDHIVVFSPHDKKRLADITDLLLKELKERLAEKGITLEWDRSITQIIAEKSYDPGMGARPLRRYIQEKIEGVIATKLLNKKLKSGDKFKISKETLQ